MDAKLLAVVVMVMCSLVECQRGTPPTIRPWRVRNEYIKRGEPETIECLATGNPTPEYTWLYEDKNGQMKEVTNNNMVTYDPKTGILTLTKDFNILADGNYSCVAFNEHGKAMTPPISIETADVINFPGNDQSPSTPVDGFPSKYLKLPCINIKDFKSKPAIDLQWQGGKREKTSTGETELKFIKLDLDSKKNLALDKEGSLHFLWLEDQDFAYTYYTCAGYNKIQLVTYTNPFNYNLKQITGIRTPRDPMLVYNKDVTAMAGTTAELQCLFSYYKPTEELEIIWKHRNVEVGRGQIATINTVKVPDDTQDQSGEYQCTPSIGNAVGKVILTIISPPEFIPGQELSAKSVPHGKDAVFRCGTSSYQAHQEAPVWYVNADKLVLDCEDPNLIACKEKLPGGAMKCVPRCDGDPQCNDEEDENGCGTTSCGEGQKLCKGACVNRNDVCELGVPCTWPRFKCTDGSRCINEDQICNGVNDCTDKSDEQLCLGGEEIQAGRFIVSSDRKELRLPSVTLSDQMCFQCSVKNQHGMVFGDGCLSVIDNIRLNYGPNDTYNVEPGMYINVGVDATTDSLYQKQMNYKWVMYNETVGEDGNVHTEVIPFPFGQYSQYFRRSGSGKNMTFIIPDANNKEDRNKDTYEAYLAITRNIKYAINISHPFETLLVNFTIVGSVIEPPPVPVEVVQTATFNWWIIALVLAVAVLFIVIALIVCHMYRNRGGTYPLDKKEHQAGHDPAQELKDNAFHDVGRVVDDDFDDINRADEIPPSERHME